MIEITNQESLKNEIAKLSNELSFFVVDSEDSFKLAANQLIKIKQYRNKINEMFDPAIKQAHDTHKSFLATKKQFIEPVESSEAMLNKAIRIYNIEQQRIADEARLKAQEEARKFEEEERKKLIAEAAKAKEAGDEKESQAILSQAETLKITPTETPISIAPKVDGLGSRRVWKAKVVDESLVPVMFEGVVLRIIDQPSLNKIARESKGNVKIPGVVFYDEEVLIVNSK